MIATYSTFDTVAQPERDWTKFEYHDFNRRKKTLQPLLASQTLESERYTTETKYDLMGRRIEEIDQEGIGTAFGFDALGRLVGVTNVYRTSTIAPGAATPPPDQSVTRYEYDELGNLVKQFDGNQFELNGNVWQFVPEPKPTQFAYDKLGRRIERRLPMSVDQPGKFIESYVYDPMISVPGKALQRTTHTDFNGTKVQTDYDKRGRLVSKQALQNPEDPDLIAAFTYFANGQREKMNDASGITTYAYQCSRKGSVPIIA